MSDIGDIDALAAEFALGTLDAAERAQAQAKLADDPGFAVKVRLWERRLSELHLMVEPVEPDADIWQRIKGKLPTIAPRLEAPPTPEPAADAAAAEAPPLSTVATAADVVTGAAAALAAASTPSSSSPATELPPPPSLSTPPPPPPLEVPAPLSPLTPSDPAAPVEPTVTLPPAPTLPSLEQPVSSEATIPEPASPDVQAPIVERAVDDTKSRRKVRRWRRFSALLLLILLAIAALVAAWKYAPERVPPQLRPVELLRLIGINVATPGTPSPRRPAPPESQFDE